MNSEMVKSGIVVLTGRDEMNMADTDMIVN
jgi:hypothetical protein